MQYSNTILNQLLNFLPRNQFNRFVGQHDGDRYTKKFSSWNQFILMLYAQATGKESLREVETGFKVNSGAWYHLGVKTVSRSTLSDANSRRSYQIFEKLFYSLLEQCRDITPENKFSFKNPLYSLDATVIKLCLSMFDWAKYTRTKGALKLHTLLDNRTMIPELIVCSDGKKGDITAGREMNIPETLEDGSIVVFDRAYVDYSWWKELDDNNIFFVSRTKENIHTTVMGQHRESEDISILSDDKVIIGEHYGYEKYSKVLRRVRFIDKEKDKVYEYVTNNFELSALQIAEIYKQRWQIELFFKWIKQNLKIKTFLGTTENAVLTQIWIAMIYYLLLAYIKFQTNFKKPLLEFTRMIKEVFLVRRNLIDLLSLDFNNIHKLSDPPDPQMEMF